MLQKHCLQPEAHIQKERHVSHTIQHIRNKSGRVLAHWCVCVCACVLVCVCGCVCVRVYIDTKCLARLHDLRRTRRRWRPRPQFPT